MFYKTFILLSSFILRSNVSNCVHWSLWMYKHVKRKAIYETNTLMEAETSGSRGKYKKPACHDSPLKKNIHPIGKSKKTTPTKVKYIQACRYYRNCSDEILVLKKVLVYRKLFFYSNKFTFVFAPGRWKVRQKSWQRKETKDGRMLSP